MLIEFYNWIQLRTINGHTVKNVYLIIICNFHPQAFCVCNRIQQNNLWNHSLPSIRFTSTSVFQFRPIWDEKSQKKNKQYSEKASSDHGPWSLTTFILVDATLIFLWKVKEVTLFVFLYDFVGSYVPYLVIKQLNLLWSSQNNINAIYINLMIIVYLGVHMFNDIPF
jgi:hypothetical protein